MKSVNPDSIEVNPSPQDFKTPINNKILIDNNEESKININHGLFSRLIIHFLFFSYLLSKINFNFKFIFTNIPLFTLYKIEFFRLITNPFICETFYELITSIIMVSTIINNFENKEGTILMIFKFCYNSIISQILLLVIYYFISYINPISLVYRINSREFLCCAYLVKHLLTTDTKRILNPYFGELNDRFVIVLFLFMYLFLNKEYRIDNLFCLYYGFLICKYNKFFELEFLSSKYITYIELSDIGKILKIFDNFVSIQNIFIQINNNKNNFNNYLKNGNIDINDERIGLKTANELEDKDFFI